MMCQQMESAPGIRLRPSRRLLYIPVNSPVPLSRLPSLTSGGGCLSRVCSRAKMTAVVVRAVHLPADSEYLCLFALSCLHLWLMMPHHYVLGSLLRTAASLALIPRQPRAPSAPAAASRCSPSRAVFAVAA